MSLYLFRDWVNDLEREVARTSRLMDQHFGQGFTTQQLMHPLELLPRQSLVTTAYIRPWRIQSRDTGSSVKVDKDSFQVHLDVQQFSPEEITVKVTGENCVTVEGSHEEKPDEHGYISRRFVRRYMVPKGYDMSGLTSSLSSDGVLTLSAPRLALDQPQERTIPITHTGKQHAAMKQKEQPQEHNKDDRK